MSAAAILGFLLAISTGSDTPDSVGKAAPAADTTSYSEVVVGRGLSASWVALRELGQWTPETRSQIQRDNPQVALDEDLQGKHLRLRRSLDQRRLEPARKLELGVRKAVVVRIQGKAERILPGGESAPLVPNEFLPVGTRIHTFAGGSVELVIDNQSIFRLRENSRLTLETIQDSSSVGKPTTQVSLEAGSVWTKVRRWAGSLVQYKVRLPNGIAGVHGTIFECAILPDGKGRVEVLEGQVGVAGNGSPTEVLVAEGHRTVIDAQGGVGAVESFSPVQPSSLDLNDESRSQSIENQRMASVQWSEKRASLSPFGHPRY
jgi:ferric-dicitrate binding protein FerR (iron transport regulator)